MKLDQSDLTHVLVIETLVFASVFILVRYGYAPIRAWLRREHGRYDRVLNHQLLLNISPAVAMTLAGSLMAFTALVLYLLLQDPISPVIGAIVAYFFPAIILRHMEQKRRQRLEAQLVDGIMCMASGVRAGLTLVQAIELLVRNMTKPIKQEFEQLLREYQMGLDLNQAMRNASNRIGLSNYRLLFTAIEMHRQRGGDVGESLDRIAESIREIQRLEGKLEAITAQGRAQARMMALMPVVIVIVYYLIDPEGVKLLLTEPIGRLLILIAFVLILAGFLWIRRIMAVDI